MRSLAISFHTTRFLGSKPGVIHVVPKCNKSVLTDFLILASLVKSRENNKLANCGV